MTFLLSLAVLQAGALAASLTGGTTLSSAASAPRPVDYTSGTLSFELGNRRARLEGGVSFTSGDLRVTGKRALVDLGPAGGAPALQEPKAKASTPGKKPAKRPAMLPGLGGQEVQRFVVEGEVHVEKAGRTADGESAIYEAKEQTLTLSGPSVGKVPSPGPVLQDGQETLLGERVTLRLDTDDIEVKEPRLQLRRSLEEGGKSLPAKVEARRLVLDPDRRTLRFSDAVSLRRGDLSVRAPRMLARYDASGSVDDLLLEGGVDLRQGTREGKSDRASYDGRKKSVRLLGDPSLRDRGDVLYGEMIELAIDTKEVTVHKARGRLRPEGAR